MTGNVLIVDDDPGLRETLSAILIAEGLAVATADDGARALALLPLMSEPVVVILDLEMPAIDGRDFIRFAKADPHIAMVPIIVVSGHSDCGGIEGVFAALQKPYSPMELVSLIAAGLESRALQQS